MKLKKFALTAAAAAVALTAACGGPPPAPPAGNGSVPAQSTDTAKVQPKIVRDEAGPDNSHILVKELENGDQTSVRKWDAGLLKKVTRRQHNGQVKAIRVLYRNGKIVRIEDRNAVDHAMDWSAAQIDEAATKVGKVVEEPRGAKTGKAPTNANTGKAGADDEDDE
jgi:hypothetical protein